MIQSRRVNKGYLKESLLFEGGDGYKKSKGINNSESDSDENYALQRKITRQKSRVSDETKIEGLEQFN